MLTPAYLSITGLTPQQVKSSTSCERPLPHLSAFIVHLWCVTACSPECPSADAWLVEAPLLCPSPSGSRHFFPVPVFLADPAVNHVHIYRQRSRGRGALNSDGGWGLMAALEGRWYLLICVWWWQEGKEREGDYKQKVQSMAGPTRLWEETPAERG